MPEYRCPAIHPKHGMGYLISAFLWFSSHPPIHPSEFWRILCESFPSSITVIAQSPAYSILN